MAYDIGPVIGIEGEKEFRDSIKQINENMKTLGTEMKAVASQFDKNDNSTEALTAKNKVLNKQIDEQKSKLSELEKGLAAAAEKYGENDKVTQGWRRAVNQATADLNNMERELKSNTETMEQAKSPTDDLGKEIKQVGDNAEDAGKKTFTMGDMIKANLISEAIIGGVKALGSAMISVAKGIGDAVNETVDYTSTISDMSQKTGMGAEELQKYSYAAKMSGMETETLEKAMIKSQTSFANARDGSKALQEAYKQLGLNIKEIPNSEEAFIQTLAALSDMTDESKRNALANDLFGKSYAELAPLLNEGSDGIERLKIRAEELGIIMSEDAVNAGEALGDTLDTLKLTVGGVANSLISLLLPGLSNLANEGVGFISEFSKEIKAADGDMGKIGDVIGSTLSDLVSRIAENIPEIIKGSKNLILSFVNGILDNLPEIVESGTAIVMDLIKGLIEALPQIIQAGLEVIINLANGIADSLPELIPVIVDTVLLIVETLIDNVDELIDAALAIIMGLADGLINALPILIEKMPVIIEKLVTAITDNLPKIVEMGILLIVKLAEGIIKALPKLWAKIPEVMGSLVKGFQNYFKNMAQVGENLAQGLWEGINNAKEWILDKIRGFGKSIMDGIKGVFGIHSPSTLMRDEVGKNLALGLGLGFTDEMEKVSAIMSDSIPTNFDTNLNISSSNDSKVLSDSINSNPGNVILQLLLPNGKLLAEYIAPYSDIVNGKGLVLAGRSAGL